MVKKSTKPAQGSPREELQATRLSLIRVTSLWKRVLQGSIGQSPPVSPSDETPSTFRHEFSDRRRRIIPEEMIPHETGGRGRCAPPCRFGSICELLCGVFILSRYSDHLLPAQCNGSCGAPANAWIDLEAPHFSKWTAWCRFPRLFAATRCIGSWARHLRKKIACTGNASQSWVSLFFFKRPRRESDRFFLTPLVF